MLQLMHTEGCHLCDLAEALLARAKQEGYIDGYQLRDIAMPEQLIEQYGTRIPVVCYHSQELGWPFDYQQLCEFIHRCENKESQCD